MGSLPITFLFASFFIGLEDAELSSFRVSLLGANFLAGVLPVLCLHPHWFHCQNLPHSTIPASPFQRSITSSSDALDGEGDMAERRRLQPLTSFPVLDPEEWDAQLWAWSKE